MNRRRFLFGVAAAGLALSGAGAYLLTGPEKELAEFVNFPDSDKTIPTGAGLVMKYPILGSKHCLVHIKQSHIMTYDIKDPKTGKRGYSTPTEAELKRIDPIQKDIYTILQFLVNNGITRSVYTEGIPSNADLLKDKAKLEEYLALNYDHYENKEFKDRYRYAPGGDLRLGLEGKIELNGEDPEALLKAHLYVKNGGRTMDPVVLDEREDALLKLISDSKDRLSVVVFGAQHCFGGEKSCGKEYLKFKGRGRDNIYDWNQKHPNDKFCLIEVYPESFLKDY